jgi:hypothetical protein
MCVTRLPIAYSPRQQVAGHTRLTQCRILASACLPSAILPSRDFPTEFLHLFVLSLIDSAVVKALCYKPECRGFKTR